IVTRQGVGPALDPASAPAAFGTIPTALGSVPAVLGSAPAPSESSPFAPSSPGDAAPPTGAAAPGAAAMLERLAKRIEVALGEVKKLSARAPQARLALMIAAAVVPALILALVVGVILARRSADGPGGLVAGSEETSPKEILAAAGKGPEALEKLAEGRPDDPGVLRELALSYARDGRTKDALGAVRRAAAAGSVAPLGPELVAIA